MPKKTPNPQKLGYARVSTADQSTAMQREALRVAGCQRIYEDVASGAKESRKALDEALSSLKPGDQLVVWKLDRLGRSLPHLISILQELHARGVHFESLTEKLDTATPYGEFIFHVIAALAQMERKLISERTRCGLDTARRRGKRLGRRPSLTSAQIREARRYRRSGTMSVRDLARRYGVSEMTVYRAAGCKQTDPEILRNLAN